MMMTSRIWIIAGTTALSASLLAFPARAGTINTVTANGYTFTNNDGPGGGGTVSTNFNGISNTGQVAGITLDANMNLLSNFAGNPTGTLSTLSNTLPAMAFGINSGGTIVGGAPAFRTTIGGMPQTLAMPMGATSETAFGINDKGLIVGQYTNATAMPGFLLNGTTFTTINVPAGPNNTVNAQEINNNGLVVGFYLGADNQVHGFTFDSTRSILSLIADPTIPTVKGEPAGTTLVFSQILGINDSGLAVGYYGDSTTSQHGYLYDTLTGKYTFLDDPNAAFTPGGVEVTQITGITNSGELTGFYTDAAGVAHGFIANAVPEPSPLTLQGLGLMGVLGLAARRRRARAG